MSKLFYQCVFWLFLTVASCLWFWDVLERLFRGPDEEPGSQAEAWDELAPEDQAYLKWFHK